MSYSILLIFLSRLPDLQLAESIKDRDVEEANAHTEIRYIILLEHVILEITIFSHSNIESLTKAEISDSIIAILLL